MKRKAQSILEYVIILAAIIAAIILAARTMVQPSVEKTFSDATTAMDDMSDRFGEGLGGGRE